MFGPGSTVCVSESAIANADLLQGPSIEHQDPLAWLLSPQFPAVPCTSDLAQLERAQLRL